MADSIDTGALAAHFAEQDAKTNRVADVTTAVQTGAQYSPADWAKSNQLSLSSGVDVHALAANPLIRAAAENKAKGDALNVPSLVDTHPQVAQWMTDPVNAGLAQGNVGLLQSVSDAVSYLGVSTSAGALNLLAAGTKLIGTAGEMAGLITSDEEAATLYKNDPEGLKRFREESAAGGIARFAREAQSRSTQVMKLAPESAQARYSGLEYATTDASKSALLSPIRIASDAIRSLPTSIAMGVTILLTRNVAIASRAAATNEASALGLTGAAAEEFVQKAVTTASGKAAAAVGASTEGVAGYATQALSTEEEAAKLDVSKSAHYQQLIAEGYSPEAAKVKVVAGMSEQAGIIAGIADAAVNAAAGKLLGGILSEGKGALKSAGKTALLEGATEAVQSPLEQLGTNIGLKEIDPARSLSDNLLESAIQGLTLGVVTGGGMGALGGTTRRAAAEDTQLRDSLAKHDALAQLSEAAAKAAPVRDLDKGRFKEFMQSMVEDSPIKELYVDANALHDVLAQSPIEVQQMFAQDMPDVVKQLGEGTATDGLVRIPVEDYATHIAGTEVDKAILPHLKSDAEGLTFSQVESSMKDAQAGMQQAADELVNKHAEDVAYQADVKGVYDNILGQLEAAKRFPTAANKQYAELQKAYYVVAAEEEGVAPSEMLKRFPIKVHGGDTLGVQADTLEQPSTSITDFKGLTLLPSKEDAQVQGASAFADRPFTLLPGVSEVKLSSMEALPNPAIYETPEAKAKISQLAKDIKKNGIEPVLVAERADGTRYLAEGQHRARALQQLGYDAVPARVVSERAQSSSAYGYRARDAARKATLQSFAPEQVKDLLRKTDWAILTAENPAAQQLTPEENAARMAELKADLVSEGIQFEVVEGKYGGNIENSVMLVGVTQDRATAIGQKYGQESVLTRAGLVYSDGTINPARAVNTFKKAPEDFYTRVPSTGALFAVDINFDVKLTSPNGRVGEVEIEGVHFSNADRPTLSGRAYGTGIKGAEAKRLTQAEDSRIKERISFYVDEGKGVFPEQGIGKFKHELTLTNMYDAANNPLRIPADDFNAFESGVINAGFDGYYVKAGFGRQGTAVVLGEASRNLQVDLPTELNQSALLDSNFALWFGNSEIVDAEGQPLVMYHGTAQDITQFTPKQAGAIFLTPDPNTAGEFAITSEGWKMRHGVDNTTGANILPVYVSAQKVFDSDNAAHIAAAQKALGAGWAGEEFSNSIEDVKRGGWTAIENPVFQKYLKDAGYDGFYVYENGVKNVAVYEPSQVKSAVGNRGTFDPNDANILHQGDPLYNRALVSAREAGSTSVSAIKRNLGVQYGRAEAIIKQMEADGYIVPAEAGTYKVGRSGIEMPVSNLGQYDVTDKINTADLLFQADITTAHPMFYSQLAKAVAAASDKVFTSGPQVKAWLEANAGKLGVKKDEIFWSGINDWLDAQDKVSKADVQAFLGANGVQVEEAMLGAKAPEGYVKKEGDKWTSYTGEGKHYGTYNNEVDANNSLQRVNAHLDRQTKYKSQQLPGGENYRELLLTLPVGEGTNKARVSELQAQYDELLLGGLGEMKDNEAELGRKLRNLETQLRMAKKEGEPASFKAPHFDSKPNILAHIRFNERTDADGARVMFVEEIQSDWGQKGKKKGFNLKPEIVEKKVGDRTVYQVISRGEIFSEEISRAAAENVAAQESNKLHGIPSAPFVTDTKSWTALALKRVIAYAAENNFDKVAWTTGEQQAERYDLSKQIDVVEARRNAGTDSYHLIARKDGTAVVFKDDVSSSELADYVGKELAKKIVKDTPEYTGKVIKYAGLDLKVGGEGMKGFYDQIVPQVTNDILKKLGGGKVEAVSVFNDKVEKKGNDFITYTSNEKHVFSTEAHAKEYLDKFGQSNTPQQGFTLTPEMKNKVLAEGQALFQPNRGSFNPSILTISLLRDADLSTFLHETGHAFLELDMARASRPDAPQRVKDRAAAILNWFGVVDMDAWNAMTLDQKRLNHEKFARGFEAYLLEGKAPSIELNGIFASFRSWLLHIYRRLTNLNVELTPEVRQVFDKMLATDEQIKAAEEARNYGKLALEGLGTAYSEQDAKATADSVDELQKRSLRDMKWLSNAKDKALKQMQVQADSKRRAIRAEVTADVMAEPINQARTWLRKGEMVDPNTGEQVKADKGFRLDNAAIAELYPETMLSRPDTTQLRGMTMNNGLAPDLVADMFGFKSGDQLVRELINGEDAKTKIDGLTDSRMLQENGDLVDERAVREAADRAVHNEARARFMATGLKALTNSPLSSYQLAKAATATAKEVIAAKKVRDLRPAQYTSAETKANKEALKEVAKDPAKAQRAQRSALLNNRLAAASLDALEEVRKGIEKMNKVQKAAAQKNMRGEYLIQMNALLDRFDLRKSTTLKSLDINRTPLANWIQTEADRLSAVVPDIPGWVQNESVITSYKNLTMEEFRGVVDTVKSLELMARREEQQYQAIRGMKFAEERKALLDRIREFHPEAFSVDGEPLGMSPKFVRHFGDTVSELGDKFAGEFLNAETIIDLLEGGNFGVVNESLFGRMSKRADWKALRMGAIQEQLKPLFEQYSLKERYNFGRKDIAAEIDMSLTRENALVVALLHGNAEGRERLANYGWGLDTQQAIVNLLDAKDVKLAEGIWNLFDNELWPELKELNDRTRGKSPPKVEALPVQTKHGLVKGGYFRLKYDSNLDERAHNLDEGAAVKELLGGGLGMSAKTNQGSSTERKQNVTMRPRLDLGVFAEAVGETVHDLAFREAVADTMRMLNNPGVQNTIKTAAGTPAYRALVSRVREIAAPPRNPAGFIEKTLTVARKNTIVTLMSGVGTALQNFTGLASAYSGSRLNAGRLTKEIALFYSPKMVERYQFAMDNSDYMKGRHNSFERDLQNQVKNMTVNANVMPEMGTWLALMGLVDKGTAVPVWNAAFYEGMAQFANDKAKAVEYADHTVRQTMGSGREIDIAQIMGGHGGWGQLKRVFTMFQSYFNGQLGQLVRSGVVNKQLAKTNPVLASARFTKDFMLVYVIPMMLTKMLLSPPDKDPEEWMRNYTRAFAQYGMAMIPLWGSMMNSMWAAFDPTARNYGYKITPVESGVEGIIKGVKSATAVAGGEYEDKDLKNIIMGTGFAVGLPGKLVSDTVLGTKAFLQDEAGPMAVIQGPPRK